MSERDCVDACILVTACQMLRAGGKQRNPEHITTPDRRVADNNQHVAAPRTQSSSPQPSDNPKLKERNQSCSTVTMDTAAGVEAAGFIHQSRPRTPVQPCHPRNLVTSHTSTTLHASTSNRTHKHGATTMAAATARKDQQTTLHAMLLPVAQQRGCHQHKMPWVPATTFSNNHSCAQA